MEVLIENRQNRHNLSMKKVEKRAKQILNALGLPDAQLSVLIVDDDQIASLNQNYLNHTGPTNVISFPMQEGPFAEITPELLGDVVISADTAHREAVDADIPITSRIDQLLIHGILHLVGYDHVHSKDEADRMERKSEELYERIKRET